MNLVPQLRGTYRHGDLRRALIAAGMELARSGGPEAVVLRETTRRAGVVPNAAYRHFASRVDLLAAVRSAAIAAAAVAMEKEFARVQRRSTASRSADDAVQLARASLRAVGLGYLRFAFEEPGLFRTAFVSAAAAGDAPERRAPDPERAGASGRNPFELLGDALDRYVESGLLAPTSRSRIPRVVGRARTGDARARRPAARHAAHEAARAGRTGRRDGRTRLVNRACPARPATPPGGGARCRTLG